MTLTHQIQAQRAAISDLAQHYGASHIPVFVSVARGEERPDSDIDFLVELPRGYDLFAKCIPLTECIAAT